VGGRSLGGPIFGGLRSYQNVVQTQAIGCSERDDKLKLWTQGKGDTGERQRH